VSHTQAEGPQQLLDENLVLRTTHDPTSIAGGARDRIRAADREAAVRFETMKDVLSRSVSSQRFQMQVLGGFAALALVLAAVGLYLVLSYLVTCNRSGIAIRMALGAQRHSVFVMVTGRALRLAAAGVGFGLAGCFAVRRVLARFIFGIGPSDPLTLVAAVLVLLMVALVASWFPARRAMQVDPISALRED
jgi:ABC-type antimicrobial peptide transport system permease subunit